MGYSSEKQIFQRLIDFCYYRETTVLVFMVIHIVTCFFLYIVTMHDTVDDIFFTNWKFKFFLLDAG